MANNVVTYTINMGGNAYQGIAKLDNAVSGLSGKVGILRNRLDSIGSLGLGLSGVINAFEKLSATFNELTEANAAQRMAETRLQQVMRNTMGANIAQIQSINDLAAAQLRYYMHVADPEALSDTEWAMRVKELEWVREEEAKADRL